MSLTFPLTGRALVDPLAGVSAAVERRAWLAPLLALMLAVTFSGATYALQLDTARVVVPTLAKKGDLQKVSEKELNDQIQQAQRIGLVTGVAKGVAGMPLALLFLALALKLVAWLFVKPVPFSAAFTVASVALLPIALYHLVFGVAVWQQDFVTVRSAEALVPSSLAFLARAPGALKRAYGAVDFFQLWSAVLVGLGMAKAMGIKAWKGLTLGLGLYLLFAAAFLVGLPGLAEGMGGGGPGGGGRRGPG
jgi:Yip1 domain